MKCPVVWWILKIPFYRRANFTGNHTDRSHFSGPVHSKIEEFRHSNRRFIKGCIIVYIVRIFSCSELVEPHIIPLKVRLAVALKEAAKWQVFVRDCEHWILLVYRILILYCVYTCNLVVYRVLFVIMTTNIETNSAVSEEGHVLTAYFFFWSY